MNTLEKRQADYDTACGFLLEEDKNKVIPAYKIFLRLADVGHLESQFKLAWMLSCPQKGIKIDFKKAEFWFTIAAERKHTQSQFELGMLYLDKQFTSKSDVLAYKWLTIAFLNSYKPAKQKKDELQKRMSEKDIEEGGNLAIKWLDTNRPDIDLFIKTNTPPKETKCVPQK